MAEHAALWCSPPSVAARPPIPPPPPPKSPFLLQAHASLTAVGAFSVASWPYAAKLAWAPVVDNLFAARVGRRKSWILPVQAASAALLLAGAGPAAAAVEGGAVGTAAAYFFALVLLAATQDIAVDGWALTLLSRARVG